MKPDTAQLNDNRPVRIRRAKHDKENPYFMGLRSTAQDRTLTYEARGVLFYLLSKPTGWEVKVNDLKQDGAGRDKVYRILGELEEHNYLARDFIRNRAGVVTGIEYVIYEQPFTEKPETAQPDTVNTDHRDKREGDKKDPSVDGEPSTPIDHNLKVQIALHLQGMNPDAAGSFTGVLAQTAAGVWRGLLHRQKLNRADYDKVATSIKAFVGDWKTRNPDLHLPTTRDSFSTAYGVYASDVLAGKIKPSKRVMKFDPKCRTCKGTGIEVFADGTAAECNCGVVTNG